MAEDAAVVTPCTHCGVLLDGGEERFCCVGCELAWSLIHAAGGDPYYARRELPGSRPEPIGEGWSLVPVEIVNGRAVARLGVDRLTCAACAWVVERVVGELPGVEEVLVSHGSGRATVRFDPDRVDVPAIAARIGALGYRPRPLSARPVDRDLLLRLGVAAFAAMNVMLLSASIYAGWFDGMEAWEASLFRWASLALATPAALWSATPLYARAWAGLRHGVLHVDLPVSIGIIAMYVHGVWATLGGRDAWLDSLTMLVALLLGGRVVEQGHRRRAQEAATALAGELPGRARRLVDGGVVEVPTASLLPGDSVEVGAGDQLPADGLVEAGTALVRRALVTGEAEPVELRVGDRVHAGTMVESGWLRFRLDRPPGDTLLARATRIVGEAADRPSAGWLTDRVAPWFTLVTLLLAAGTLVGWWIGAGPARAAEVTMSVLVVACPCALALAAPLANGAGLGAAGRRGLLVRSGDVLSALVDVDLVAFDKTGTVTEGAPAVVRAAPWVLRIAAGLERGSSHPIARAIRAAAAEGGIPLPEVRAVREVPGEGISGEVEGRRWRLTRAGPGEVRLEAVEDAELGGVLVLRDRVRADAVATIQALRATGLEVVLLSGDHPEVVRNIAAGLGLDTAFRGQGGAAALGGQSPDDKAAWVRDRQAEGRRVLFVGDGLNDGPALAAATVGVAMGEGAPSSILVGDVVLTGDGLRPLAAGREIARVVREAIRGNVARSLCYNLVAVGAAMAGLVNPLVAAVAMPLSSALVVWGASRVEARVARALGEAV